MAYQSITKYTSPNQNARPAGARIASITIHHWGVRGQKFQNVVNYLCRSGGNTSAHYVVEAGKVACIVSPGRRAWHAGNNVANNTSIGIECRPEATDGDYATVAELVRNLRAVYGNLPLKRHSDWKNTACPGVWDLARIDRLARTASTVSNPSGGTGTVTNPSSPGGLPAPVKDWFTMATQADLVAAVKKAFNSADFRTQVFLGAWEYPQIPVPGTDRTESPKQFLVATRLAAVQAVHAAAKAEGLDEAAVQRIVDSVAKVDAKDVIAQLEVELSVKEG